MDNLINRQMAIDAFQKELCREREYAISFKGCERVLNNVPSVQPEQRWILCSERLPEDGLYLVTTSKGQVQVHVFSHNGNSEEYWMRCNKAWMPLPEPYQKGERNG